MAAAVAVERVERIEEPPVDEVHPVPVVHGFIPTICADNPKGEVGQHLKEMAGIQRHKEWRKVVGYPSRTAPREPGTRVKTIHFVRHGEGEHNAAAAAFGVESYHKEDYADARLTELGKAQAAGLREYTEKLKNVKTVFVSPLSRATLTALIGFDLSPAEQRRFIAIEYLREQSGRNPCDRRRNISVLNKEFPLVDYSKITSDEDGMWTDAVRESKHAVSHRVQEVLEFFREWEEDEFAVVAHSGLLLTLLNINVEPTDKALGNWLVTCELRSVDVVFYD